MLNNNTSCYCAWWFQGRYCDRCYRLVEDEMKGPYIRYEKSKKCLGCAGRGGWYSPDNGQWVTCNCGKGR